MLKIKNNFTERTITSFFFALCTLSAIFINSWLFAVLFFVFSIAAVNELIKFSPINLLKIEKLILYIFSIIIYILILLSSKYNNLEKYLLLIAPMILIIFILLLFIKKDNLLITISFFVFSIIYSVLPFALLNYFSEIAIKNNYPQFLFLFSFFILIWINDSAAYLSGKTLGKNKLCPSVSPGKTWEGLIGGVVSTIIVAFVLQHFFPFDKTYFWYIFSLIILAFGTFGDLIESLLKRNKGYKDSGDFFPGHGGVLDRFDSTLFAAPIIFIYLFIYFN